MSNLFSWLIFIVCLFAPAGLLVGILGCFIRNKFSGHPKEDIIVDYSMLTLCICYFIALYYLFIK